MNVRRYVPQKCNVRDMYNHHILSVVPTLRSYNEYGPLMD